MTVASLRRQPAMQAAGLPVWLERKGRGVVSVEREEEGCAAAALSDRARKTAAQGKQSVFLSPVLARA
jgi:hypothetical protein